MVMRAKSEEFTDMELKALCPLSSKQTYSNQEEMLNLRRHPNGLRSIRDEVIQKFITVEEMSIKIWECEHGFLRTIKKINLK